MEDTYMAAWNSIPPNDPEHLSAYLYRIVRNLSFNRLKERSAQKRGSGQLDLVLDELEICTASDRSVERAVEARELSHAISDFLGSLPRDERIIFTSRYCLMCPTADIAQRLGFTESKVRTSLYRSRKKLHLYLRKEGLL